MKSLAAATTARSAVGFEWFSEAGHGVIGDDSPLISRISEFLQKVITHFHEIDRELCAPVV